jgi:hypothetical protein
MVEGPDAEMENASRGAEQELPALHLHQAPGQERPSSLGGHFISKCICKKILSRDQDPLFISFSRKEFF